MWSTHLGRETRKRWQGGGHCPLSYTANPLIYALSLRYTNTNTHKKQYTHTHTICIFTTVTALVSQTVNQLIYTLLYNIDNTNTDTEKYSHTKYKYTCSDMQNSLFHCQARFKLDPKVQREAQEFRPLSVCFLFRTSGKHCESHSQAGSTTRIALFQALSIHTLF